MMALIATLLAATSAAGGQEDAPRYGAVQKRLYELGHELSLLGGGLPSDPYYKGITLTAGYTVHLTGWLAWEVAQGTYSYNLDSHLKKEILRFRTVDKRAFPEITWAVASHLVLKPLYGKEALFNTDVVHVEVFLALGPALVERNIKDNAKRIPNFGGDGALGLRLWVTRVVSLRFELGELVYVVPEGVRNALHARAGFAFNLQGEP